MRRDCHAGLEEPAPGLTRGHPGIRGWIAGLARNHAAPRGAKRYVRRDRRGRIAESDDQSRSLSTDRRRKAKKRVKAGQGDKGDRKS